MSKTFELDEIPQLSAIILDRQGSLDDQSAAKDRHLALPNWFREGLPPLSTEYRAQQLRLWQEISGIDEDYCPIIHEQSKIPIEGFSRPGFYQWGDAGLAGDHIIAYGHLLKRSGIKAGDHVLEYGPGIGQLSLAFARTGAIVDAVEIDVHFSRIVNALAKTYDVSLQCHRELFGYVPPGRRPDLVVFYESFHHCWDFHLMVGHLRRILSPKGKVLMAGEPIVAASTPLLPYPWGIRLDAECVCVIARRGWMELGFQEDFIASLFTSNDFTWTKHGSDLSRLAQVYEANPV